MSQTYLYVQIIKNKPSHSEPSWRFSTVKLTQAERTNRLGKLHHLIVREKLEFFVWIPGLYDQLELTDRVPVISLPIESSIYRCYVLETSIFLSNYN